LLSASFKEVNRNLKDQCEKNEQRWRSSVCLTAMILLVVACASSCGREDPPDWEKIDMTSTATSTPAPPQTTDDLIVYLDTSGSMAGYATKDGQNVFGRTLRAVRDIATSFKQPVRVSVRYVAATVGNPDPDGALALQKASINPGIYNGGETDLAGAINSFKPRSELPATQMSLTGSANSEATPVDTSQPGFPPPARFHILITDGVQSTRGQNTKLACLKGSDATCVREKIINLIKQGWGGYVIGLRSQFHGKVYSETGGGSFVYDTPEGNWKRYRPFYLYIFSPDPAALDEFVDALRERVRPVTQGEWLRVLALTSPYVTEAAKAELTVPKESEDAVESSGEQGENPARFTIEVNRDKDEATPAPFTVAVIVPWSKQVQDSAPPKELVKLLRWAVEPIYPQKDAVDSGSLRRYPTVKVANSGSTQTLDTQGRVPVQLTVGWPRSTAKPSWGVYRLQAKLDLSMEHDPLPWIRQWSTDLDNSAEYADRTLDLETVLISLWRNPVLEQQKVTTVYLRIGPQ
jgi:hypothetical protein